MKDNLYTFILTPNDAPNGLFNHLGAFVKTGAVLVCIVGRGWLKESIPGNKSDLLDISCCDPPNRE